MPKSILDVNILLVDTIMLWTREYVWNKDVSNWNSFYERTNIKNDKFVQSGKQEPSYHGQYYDPVTGWFIKLGNILSISGSIPINCNT